MSDFRNTPSFANLSIASSTGTRIASTITDHAMIWLSCVVLSLLAYHSTLAGSSRGTKREPEK